MPAITEKATAVNPAADQGPADTTEPIHLRRATIADADALALVGAATFLEAFTWMLPGANILVHCRRHHTPEAWRVFFTRPDTFITLAEAAGGAPVGYSMLATPDLPTFDVLPTDIELKRIYLFSRFRSSVTPVLDQDRKPIPGMRAGQALMDAALLAARRQGRSRVLLGTHAGNERAIQFYRRNGFTEVGTRTFQVGDQICDDLIFGRVL